MQDLQCLATNVLNQFHFWVDLYESLMQNKVKNYRVPHIRLQNSLLFNLFTGWEFYPPQFHEKKKLGMQMWYVSIERFLMATQKSSSSRLKGFCIVHTTCTLGSDYFWVWNSISNSHSCYAKCFWKSSKLGNLRTLEHKVGPNDWICIYIVFALLATVWYQK